ncbi:MAG: hypothetical protein ACLSAH_09975 [Bilophila wadsworthia]
MLHRVGIDDQPSGCLQPHYFSEDARRACHRAGLNHILFADEPTRRWM